MKKPPLRGRSLAHAGFLVLLGGTACQSPGLGATDGAPDGPGLLGGPDAAAEGGPGSDAASVGERPPGGEPVLDGDPNSPTFCGRGASVPGAAPLAGFCVKHYAQIDEPRAIAFAPNGDLFVAAPSRGTPGGAQGGPGAILVVSDDDRDGLGEVKTFLDGVPEVHGLAFGASALYFTIGDDILRVPYADGQRAATGKPQSLGMPASFAAGGRWTHGLALSRGGQLYASRGEYGVCGASHGGEISAVSHEGGGAGAVTTTIAAGFRNPMYLRCHAEDEVCAAMELGDDLHQPGAREKMVFLRPSTRYGFPCCYTTGLPEQPGAACDDVTMEEASFPLESTPFGFDWEPGRWDAPWKGGVFVALHGSAYTNPLWKGVAIVWAPTDPTTHVPVQDWTTFVDGFGPGGRLLQRPSDIKFSPDGRMFFADDNGGHIFWVAPTTLLVPNPTPPSP
jgi:glucose/arabinose dehydrogenase